MGDAVGGTSVAAHEAAVRRIAQAGGRMISVPQLFCERRGPSTSWFG